MLVRLLIHSLEKKKGISLWSILLITATYPLGMLWHLYDTPKYNLKQWDWFYDIEFSDTPAWIVKWAMDDITNVMIAVAFLLHAWSNKIMRCMLIEYTLYRTLEVWRFFKNFKTVEYNLIYLITFGLGLVVWYLTLKNKK